PFADEDATSLLADYPHLVVVRSFSKAYSLAGLRVGYALASPAVVDLLDCVRDSYNLDALAQAGAQAALEDTAYTASCIESIKALRTSMFLWYHELGWQCYPSQANFHFVEPRNAAGETGLAVAESCLAQLTQQRVLVRHFPKHRLTQGFLRVSLGTEHEMQRFRDAVDSWLKTT
ncbi:MAG: aminotransferase class I/II-fold pyridoxal phosphate-dependent enzyme, partial [Verrucomicrobiota bacterium]